MRMRPNALEGSLPGGNVLMPEMASERAGRAMSRAGAWGGREGDPVYLLGAPHYGRSVSHVPKRETRSFSRSGCREETEKCRQGG